MTSMPASRSAAATTFAPRSCPSRPGVATSTRIGRIQRFNGTTFLNSGGESWEQSDGCKQLSNTELSQRQRRREKLAARLTQRQLAKLAFLSRDEEHLRRTPSHRTIPASGGNRFDDQSRIRTELGESGCGVQTNAMLALSGAVRTTPVRLDRQDTRERIEPPLLGVHRSIGGFPPVAIEEARHDAVAAPPVPNENATWPQHARKLGHHSPIVGGIGEEAEGREQVQHGVELSGPFRSETPHVAAVIPQPCPRASCAGAGEQLGREVKAVDVEPRLGEEVRMAALAAWHVENASAVRQSEDLQQPGDFVRSEE